MRWYKHEHRCEECHDVIAKYESPQKILSEKEKAWYIKHHDDMVHGTQKDRDYYKRFSRQGE